jgi:hypothetical protein
MLSAVAARFSGSADLLAACWDKGYPGNLAAGRRPCHGVNSPAGWGASRLLDLLASDGDPARSEKLARSLLLMSILSQVGCWQQLVAGGCVRSSAGAS